MKLIFLFTCLVISFSSFALTHSEVEKLLKSKNISLQGIEQQGAKVLLGEVTGHNSSLPFAKVQVLLTESEAILKSEIDSVDFHGAERLGNVVAIRFQGQYVLKQDVKAVIILGQ